MTAPRNVAFVLASTNHGPLIVNRHDRRVDSPGTGIGVGYCLLETSSYDKAECHLGMQLLTMRHNHYGDGVVAVDCGANIGVLTVEWARWMTGWGTVVAIEPQAPIFYALCGNIALNNTFNAHPIRAAVGAENGELRIPVPDYERPGSYGSLELLQSPLNEHIGQDIDYTKRLMPVKLMTIDSLNLARLDLLKIDVERMELEALTGAIETIRRLKPVLIIERVKTPEAALKAELESHGYEWHVIGMNLLAFHSSDPTRVGAGQP